jgi:hypothetical protein
MAASVCLHAGAGLFDSYVIVNTDSVTYYDVGAVTVNPDFQGANLGSFDATTDNLQLGGQTKTYKDNGSDVTGANLQYRIWQVTESGTFDSIAYSFKFNTGTNSDQEWGTEANPDYTSNILTGLIAGTYTLEVYSQISTNNTNIDPATIVSNNGGANFEATFTVTPVPEPSTYALIVGTLGFAFVLMRRRKA